MLHREEFKIRTSDCDSKMSLRPSALLDLFQETAGRHSVIYGLDTPTLIKENKSTWVLSGLLIKIDENPNWPDNIVVESWLNSLKGFKAIRDYSVLNRYGESIIKASSVWALIDIKSRRPVKIDSLKHNIEIYQEGSSIEGAIPGKIGKADNIFIEKSAETVLKVRESDIDMNDHVSNIHYITWMFSKFKKNFLEENRLKQLNISYKGEAFLNDELLYRSYIEDGSGYHTFINKISGRELCTITSKWEKG